MPACFVACGDAVLSKRYNMRLNICHSEDRKGATGEIILIGPEQIEQFCHIIGAHSGAHSREGDNDPSLRTQYRYSFESLPWTSDYELHKRMDARILECFATHLWHLKYVAIGGPVNETTAALAYERLTGIHWASAEELFSSIDHIQAEVWAYHQSLAYDRARILLLYLSDLLRLVTDARDRLAFAHSREFEMQFALRGVSKFMLAAKVQTEAAAKQYEAARMLDNTELERTDWIHKTQTFASMTLRAVQGAKKCGRIAGISSVTIAALYFLEWQVYVVLGDPRRAEIAIQAAVMYAPEDKDIRAAQVDMEELRTGEMDIVSLVEHILTKCWNT